MGYAEKGIPEPAGDQRPVGERMQWSGTCEECAAVYTVAPHPEANAAQAGRITDGPDDWEVFTQCWICDPVVSGLPYGYIAHHGPADRCPPWCLGSTVSESVGPAGGQ